MDDAMKETAMVCAPEGSPSHAVRKRYRRQMLVLGIVYAALVATISWIIPISDWPEWPRRAGALLPVIPIALMVWAMGRYLSDEPDEFYRLIQTRASLAATGFVLVLGTAWGFLEEYTGLGPFPVLIIFPIWCAGFMAGLAWAGRKYR